MTKERLGPPLLRRLALIPRDRVNTPDKTALMRLAAVMGKVHLNPDKAVTGPAPNRD
jgi:hypothetical protein